MLHAGGREGQTSLVMSDVVDGRRYASPRRPAVFGALQHGQADLFSGGYVLGKTSFQQRVQGRQQHIKQAVEPGLRLNAVKRHDQPGTEHKGGVERQPQQFVFGFALDTRPHGTAAFGTVRAGAGYIDEGHTGIEPGKHAGGGESETVGDALIILLAHAGGGDAQAEETGVEAGELVFDGRKIEEILVDEFAKFRVLLSGRAAHDGHYDLNVRIEQAFAQNALADHAGGAEEKNSHVFIRARPDFADQMV